MEPTIEANFKTGMTPTIKATFTSHEEIYQIFDLYSSLVEAGAYKKNIPYENWKELQKANYLKILIYPDSVDLVYGPIGFTQTCTINKQVKKRGFFEYAAQYVGDFFNSDSKNTNNNDIRENADKKESVNNMKGFKFDFGPCTNDNIRMSMYGLAVKNNTDTWVSYDPNTNEIVDVDIFNFDGRKFMFKVPVAIKDIAAGDIVIHNRVPMFVTEVEDDTIKAVDVRAGERKEIIPTTNMFGFNFIIKVVSLFDAVSNTPTPESPFGNMLPFFMMNNDNQDMDMDTMLMFMMMQNQSGMNMAQNPMMLYFMMKADKAESDMLPLMMMMNQSQKPQYPVPYA